MDLGSKLFIFETASFYVVQDGVELTAILLPELRSVEITGMCHLDWPWDPHDV